jgi:hypothetical protein
MVIVVFDLTALFQMALRALMRIDPEILLPIMELILHLTVHLLFL